MAREQCITFNFCQLYRGFLHMTRTIIVQYCIKVDFGLVISSRLSFFSFFFFFFCGWRRIFIRGLKLNGIRIKGRELSRVSRDFDSLMDRSVCTGLATVYWILITIFFSCLRYVETLFRRLSYRFIYFYNWEKCREQEML